MAKKKRAAKQPAKPRRLQSPPFTEAEDYFVNGKVGELTPEAIAEKLGRALCEVERRMTELGIDPTAAASRLAEKKRSDSMRGFQTKTSDAGEITAVVMTAGGSADGPKPGNRGKQYLEKFRDSIRGK